MISNPIDGRSVPRFRDKLELRTIVEASDGQEAIELAQALHPDLILMDIGLPKLDGIEAAKRIHETDPQIENTICQPRIFRRYCASRFQSRRIGLRRQDGCRKRTTDRRESCSLGQEVCRGQICGPRFYPGLGCTTLWGRRRHRVFGPLQPQNVDIALISIR